MTVNTVLLAQHMRKSAVAEGQLGARASVCGEVLVRLSLYIVEGTSEVTPEAVRQAVGGGCQSG